ncbi:MAG TPA: DNA mismatch repair protein MutS [Spirochaetia bacterium]|nr:DNA mismatch repair protein MutS [Spirochaetia bacterium]
MKACLLFKDQDFDIQRKLPAHEQALTQDLELDTLVGAMALDDKVLLEVAKKVVLSSLNDISAIRYRQDILQDCLKNPGIVREIYDLSVESIAKEKTYYLGIFSNYPSTILHRSVEVLQMFVGQLKRLRAIADEHAAKFASDGFTKLFSMLTAELGDEYFATIQNHLRELAFRDGVMISAHLGQGNKGTDYVLRKRNDKKGLIKRIFAKRPPSYSFFISERDENGAKALAELRDRGINLVANALARSTDHILSFFVLLRTELAFYIGCLNLSARLAGKGEPVCFPQPFQPDDHRLSFQGLYDVCLSLNLEQRAVGNDANADGRDLMIITGANQGGKSTLLRAIGLAQLMMQCGMFVPAESFRSNICNAVFTHYKREEDTTMKSGKLDEELKRMSDLVDSLVPNSLLLFNESFAATNEREGSEIARQIVSALSDKRIKVFYVTHLHAFARSFYDKKMENAIFLRAERKTNGARTFKILEGEPLETSFGEDLYRKIFGADNERETSGWLAGQSAPTQPRS